MCGFSFKWFSKVSKTHGFGMQPDGSPAGSQQGGGIDGAQIALRMVQAAEAAAAAAAAVASRSETKCFQNLVFLIRKTESQSLAPFETGGEVLSNI